MMIKNPVLTLFLTSLTIALSPKMAWTAQPPQPVQPDRAVTGYYWVSKTERLGPTQNARPEKLDWVDLRKHWVIDGDTHRSLCIIVPLADYILQNRNDSDAKTLYLHHLQWIDDQFFNHGSKRPQVVGDWLAKIDELQSQDCSVSLPTHERGLRFASAGKEGRPIQGSRAILTAVPAIVSSATGELGRTALGVLRNHVPQTLWNMNVANGTLNGALRAYVRANPSPDSFELLAWALPDATTESYLLDVLAPMAQPNTLPFPSNDALFAGALNQLVRTRGSALKAPFASTLLTIKEACIPNSQAVPSPDTATCKSLGNMGCGRAYLANRMCAPPEGTVLPAFSTVGAATGFCKKTPGLKGLAHKCTYRSN